MPVAIQTDLITVVSVIVGVVSLAIAIYQTVSARRARHVYETSCKGQCKRIVGLTKSIAEEVSRACEIIETEESWQVSSRTSGPDPRVTLAAKINAIRVLASQLVQYCDNLNDEHADRFGKRLFEDMRKEIPHGECLSRPVRGVTVASETGRVAPGSSTLANSALQPTSSADG
jgi:hypothetical protein